MEREGVRGDVQRAHGTVTVTDGREERKRSARCVAVECWTWMCGRRPAGGMGWEARAQVIWLEKDELPLCQRR